MYSVQRAIFKERRGERIVADLAAVFWLLALAASYLYFGGDVWLTRLLAYLAVLFTVYALGEFVVYRVALKLAKTQRAMLGEQSWFWSSDHEPSDRSL